ncbi:hypothetical protein Pcinc_019353 [Petrolisthes cinctipes]|uniref:EF-hand domain-containing protein n=1 Tax=Petrolisthes cinctipes TaxID=88211 RepID=A0AAE1KKI7_PETCI|nr:hypothetical protein Pcinc_019353 [Petrolisthes cinctipes]
MHCPHDLNHDGILEKRDLDLAVQHLCRRGRWGRNDPRTAKITKLMAGLWLSLLSHADKNADDKVTRREWLLLWEEVEQGRRKSTNQVLKETTHLNPRQSDTRRIPSWIKEYFHYKFMLLDVTGDGVIDEEEYVYTMGQYGASEKNAKNAWFLMARGYRVLSYKEFEKLCEDFFLSDDPNTPGNYLSARMYFAPGQQRDESPEP